MTLLLTACPFVAHEAFPALEEGSRNKISGIHIVWFRGKGEEISIASVFASALQLCLRSLNNAPGGKVETRI